MIPPIHQKVATLEAQFHCMSLVQLRYPSVFGDGEYFCVFGDLHIEQSEYVIHGQLIKNSGLDIVCQELTCRLLDRRLLLM